MMPPLIGSYRWPELDGRGVEGAALMWDRFGLLCSVGSGLLKTRASETAGGCSAFNTGTGSLGAGCGVGDSCTGGFSSTTCGAGCACASSEALVLLLRWTGTALGSLGSDLRGFRVFFSGSGTAGSFVFGLGPGFLRGSPRAVRPRGAGDAFAGVGVLAPTPTPPADARMFDAGVPCSGECGGELRLPGEDASSFIAQNTTPLQCAEGCRRSC